MRAWFISALALLACGAVATYQSLAIGVAEQAAKPGERRRFLKYPYRVLMLSQLCMGQGQLTGSQQEFGVELEGNLEFADREKKKAFVESISSGNLHNQAAKGAESALSCMMARAAAYTGHQVSWEETMKSKEVWDAKMDLNKLG